MPLNMGDNIVLRGAIMTIARFACCYPHRNVVFFLLKYFVRPPSPQLVLRHSSHRTIPTFLCGYVVKRKVSKKRPTSTIGMNDRVVNAFSTSLGVLCFLVYAVVCNFGILLL